MSQPIIFISYSHNDELEKDRLLTHLGGLQRAELIKTWSDDQIKAGADWKQEIDHTIAQAKVAILLVTADFLNSEFIVEKEVPALLTRREAGDLTIFPVIARACAWTDIDWLQKMNVRPKNGRPVWSDEGSHVDEDLADIAGEIAEIIGAKGSASLRSVQPSPNNSNKKDRGVSQQKVAVRLTMVVVSCLILGITSVLVWSLLSATNNLPTHPPVSSLTIEIPANVAWVNTGLTLQAGQFATASATGDVSLWNLPNGKASPNGGEFTCDKAEAEASAGRKYEDDCLMKDKPWGALIGRVGDGTPFVIGTSFRFESTNSGNLFLAINECCDWSDNSGAYQVTISLPK